MWGMFRGRVAVGSVAVAVGWVAVAGVLAVPVGAGTEPLVRNGGFETGDLEGWTVVDHPEPFEPLAVVGAGAPSPYGLFAPEPSGDHALVHAFDGGGPGTIDVVQEVDLPADRQLTLRFELRAGWDLERWCHACTERTFSVVVEPPGGGPPRYEGVVLAPAPGSSRLDTGVLDVSVDLSAFGGGPARVVLRAEVPGDFTGPARLQVDEVALDVAPLPVDATPGPPAAPVVTPRGGVPLPAAPASPQQARPTFTG